MQGSGHAEHMVRAFMEQTSVKHTETYSKALCTVGLYLHPNHPNHRNVHRRHSLRTCPHILTVSNCNYPTL